MAGKRSRSATRLPMLLATTALLLSCSRTPADTMLATLDRTLSHREQYVEAFHRQMDSLSVEMAAAGNDSLRWEYANLFYTIYRYYDVDSTELYTNLMQEYAARTGNPDQKSLSDGAMVRLVRSKGEFQRAMDIFESMDTTGLKVQSVRKWYSAGVTLYRWARDNMPLVGLDPEKVESRLRQLGGEYEAYFDISVHARYNTALTERDYGDPQKAIIILKDILDDESSTLHDRSLVAYYLSTVYRNLGERELRKYWLAYAANLDFQVPVRDYSSLCELATMLYEDRDFNRAASYMHIALTDALACNVSFLLQRAVEAEAMISQVALESQRRRTRLLVFLFAGMALLAAALAVVLGYSLRQRRRLATANATISSVNRELARVNGELKDANQIKDNYVSQYMKLSTFYIRQVDEMRSELRKLARSGGPEAVLSYLRSPRYADSEYRHFYQVFDDTFMKLFPHFVEKVNELLPEDLHFCRKADGSLGTELRILAVIRLGIDKSHEIAEVLNCAVRTVYKYRITLRNRAMCQPEEFEERVKRIDF